MNYRCTSCGRVFDEPRMKTTTWESIYGVGSLFGDSHSVTLKVCPHCGDDEIEEYEEESYEED